MKHPLIQTHLTFGQWTALADTPPLLEGDFAYRLWHYKRDKEAKEYPFQVWSTEYLFHSLQEAEQKIKELSTWETEFETTYCFEIEQLPFSANLDYYHPTWLYDNKGVLIDWLNAIDLNPYYGRTPSRIRFKEGEIVEVRRGNEVSLAIIADNGPTVEALYKIYARRAIQTGMFGSDASDDVYYILTGPGHEYHDHACSLHIMHPSLPIDNETRECLKHFLVIANQEE